MQLFYSQYGSGYPFIILHGLLGASGNWHTLSSKAFGEHFEVYTVDQRNHGRSPHSDVFGYPEMVADLLGFMDEQALGTAHLMGHSMGGKAAMHFALTYPERVDRLIIVDMAPRAYPPRHNEIFAALRSLNLVDYTARRDIDTALSEQIPDFGVRQFLLKNLAFERDRGYTWKMNLEGIFRNYDKINTELTADRTFDRPALFISGELSDYVEEEDELPILDLFPQAEFVTTEGAGHWIHADQPQAFAEAVLDFLRS